MQATETIIDGDLIGKKGFPMHYAALGLQPPMKTVPVENGEPQTNHHRMTLQEYAAAKRWEKEVGGTVWNGWPVLSDRESQSKIIAAAVRLHVRNSYGIEAQVLAAIEAGNVTTEAQIDAAFAS